MNYVIEDEQPKAELPKTKAIIIGGRQVGHAHPFLQADGLRWHVVLKPAPRCLFQGHGATPESALAHAIVDERAEQRMQRAQLELIETELGVLTKTDDEVLG
jgi:hypothetical protein